MKQHYFIKFDRRINKIIGCQRATLILSTLEFWFSKKPEGFYKFIEPCSHPLYKKDDSWTEELGCDPKSFTNSFKKIGIKYTSRTAFEKAKDKFQGKMYASFYDRYSNRIFFVRNDEEVSKFFSGMDTPIKAGASEEESKEKSQQLPGSNSIKNLLRNGKNSRSYKEPKNSSLNLSKDKSHAEEIIKKLIEIWTALVEEGRGQVTLGRTTIPFLKKAFSDKFDSCLEKWKKFCYDIASSRFLMGEKTSWKADLDWALIFKNIEKVFDGQYGIGDRTPKAILPSQDDLQEEIISSNESQEIKDFRTLCLKTVGNAKYITNFKKLTVEFREEGEITLIAAHKFGADLLEQSCYSYLRYILQSLGKNSQRISILAPGETRGRLIERERGGDAVPSLPLISTIEKSNSEEFSMEETILEDESLPATSLETKALREKLMNIIPSEQFPSWLSEIKVEGINEDGIAIVSLEEQHAVEYCRAHFRQKILEGVKELWQNVQHVIIQEKSEGLNGFEPIAFQDNLEENQNIFDFKSIKDDAEFLLNMVESKGEGAVLRNDPLPEISLETQELRKKLINNIPPKQFPSWLADIEVEGIGQDGTIVVTFEDQLAVNYCRVRYKKEIFQSATELWGNITDLVIQNETDNLLSLEKSGSLEIDERALMEQAIPSLLRAMLAGVAQGGAFLNDGIPQ